MSVSGQVSTMSLIDLLQWASINEKTGFLELERNGKLRRIGFREGRIVACSADDPSTLLGQFLLSRGKIRETHLRRALCEQQQSRENLGRILVRMGVLTDEDIESAIADKAGETIYGLFDWERAIFRFVPHRRLQSHAITVDFTVDEILREGLGRRDELRRIRDRFPSSGVVLERTGQPVPAGLGDLPLTSKLLDVMEAEPTIAELLLFSHASEFLVLRALLDLHEKGAVRIKEVRDVDPDLPTLLDTAAPESIDQSLTHDAAAETLAEMSLDGDDEEIADLRAEIDVAHRLLDRDEPEAALEVLQACYRAQPGALYVRQQIARAEAAFVEKAARQELAPDRIPVLRRPRESTERSDLPPEAQFLLKLIDGVTDVRSIVWLAPLREVETLRGLHVLRERGLIEFAESPAVAGGVDART